MSLNTEHRTLNTGFRPNFIVILCDNLGYGDLGCYGHPVHRTPNVDRMADEGVRFTDFYVTSGVCTPSRASVMTGCYAQRVDMHCSEDGRSVLFPLSPKGLNPEEITVARLLKQAGYATACIGKWHLGDQPEFLPTSHGFDRFFGIPYSEDMKHTRRPEWPPLPLMDDDRVIEAPVELTTITERYTHAAIEFITEHKDEPFFLYLPQATPGSEKIPEVGDAFRGRSSNDRYGDSVEELDWSTGEILKTLSNLGIDERTLVLFTSDNGAVKGHGGSNAPCSGWGYGTTEGGMREPCVVRWPGEIPAGRTCTALSTTMDILPTLAALAGVAPPSDRTIDGKDIRSLLLGESDASPYEAFYYYHMDQLQAVRAGKWKLHLALDDRITQSPKDRGPCAQRLYDLEADIGETTDVSKDHPEVVSELTRLAGKAREELGDKGRRGTGFRPAGHVARPTPRRLEG